ncbi:hypothetical protein AVEN_3517-1 [Araneus ventricosus]|uniref:Uncharacterized protein n=1 Tax=Araneus ventricosus TaxID=182803 RepID=A0A4Y2TFG7_ARAVE|nr:hypothetical protein AVEN_3517-1 [Araneus ventricosus]
MDLVILNRSQMKRTTPELAPPLQTSAPHQRVDVWPHTHDLTCNRSNTDGSSMESGFEPGTPRLRPEINVGDYKIKILQIKFIR